MSKLFVNVSREKGTIHKNIYGHFSEHLGRCIYGGLYAGENAELPHQNGMRTDVVEALKHIKVPVLRWPGGCFADEYHWKDGIGPKAQRKRMVNTHWGGVVEDNSFGTHEFMELCAQIGCAPYVNANVGSGTVQEMSEWVEYMNFDGVSPMAQLREKNGRKAPWGVKYIGVGNENWGCGGHMRPEFYADLYRQFAVYVRGYGQNKPYRIACGANAFDYRWTKVLMEQAGKAMDALTLHYYTVPGEGWKNRGNATGFNKSVFYDTLKKAFRMDELIENHKRIMQYYDPEGKVGLIVDEWGTWYDVEEGTNPGFLYQQNTMRDALVAAIHLNIFNAHCDRVVMANLAQTVNVLQSVVLTEGDRMVLTPTYHVFDLYKAHQDATLLDSYVEANLVGEKDHLVPNLHMSASKDSGGTVHITLANLAVAQSSKIEAFVSGMEVGSVQARILTGAMDAHNTFDAPENVKLASFDDITVQDGSLCFEISACAVMEITVRE